MSKLQDWWYGGGGGFVVIIAGTLVGFALIFGIWYGSAVLEARAYNRITGKNVSAWDAMFVELRVQEGAK